MIKMTILKKRVGDEGIVVQPLHFGNSPYYCVPIGLQKVNSDTVSKELANVVYPRYAEELVDSGGSMDLSFIAGAPIDVCERILYSQMLMQKMLNNLDKPKPTNICKDTNMFLVKRKQKNPTHTVYHYPVGTVVKFKPHITDLPTIVREDDVTLVVRSGMVWGSGSKMGDVTLLVIPGDETTSVIQRVDIYKLDIIKRGDGNSAATQLVRKKRMNHVMAIKRQLYTHANKTHYIVTQPNAFKLFYQLIWKVMGDGYAPGKQLSDAGYYLREKLIKQGLHKEINIDGVVYDMYNKKRIVKWFKQNINRVTENCRNTW